MVMLQTDVTVSGPIYEGAGPAAVQSAMNDTVKAVADAAYARLMSAFPEGLPERTGNLKGMVSQMVEGPMAQIDDGGCIYGPWIEGVGSRNATTRFKGYSTYRRTAQHLNDEVVPDICDQSAQTLAEDLGG